MLDIETRGIILSGKNKNCSALLFAYGKTGFLMTGPKYLNCLFFFFFWLGGGDELVGSIDWDILYVLMS